MQAIKNLNYSNYRTLGKKEKQKLIQDAVQDEKDRGPNPQGQCFFQDLNWVDFRVEQQKEKIRLCTYRHKCVGQPVAVVIMLHGLNSYIGHGAHIAHYMAKYGIITVGFDHRGFGRSQGQPGYTQSLQTHLEDSLKFIQIVRINYPKLPFFCLGLSLGGLTTYYLTLKYRYLFQGAIMMAPAIKNNVGGFLVGFTKTLASILPKKIKLMKPIYGKAARNPKVTQDIKNDQYSFSQRACLSTIQMLVSTMNKAPQTFHQYKCPFMIIQGGLDKLVNPDGAFQLYDNSATKLEDKQLLFYQKMWHDIWHQPEIPEIIQKATVWILKRLKKLQRKANNKTQNQEQKQVKIKKEKTSQKTSFKPDQHDLSEEVAVTQSQEIILQNKLHQMELNQVQNYKIQSQNQQMQKQGQNKAIQQN